MSIKLRLLLLVGTSVFTALIISLTNYLGNSRMEAAMIGNEVSMSALSNHLEADMMHDALRADALARAGRGRRPDRRLRRSGLPVSP